MTATATPRAETLGTIRLVQSAKVLGHYVYVPTIFTVGVAVLVGALLAGWGVWVLAVAVVVPTAVAVARRPQRGVLLFVVGLTVDGAIKGLGSQSYGAWKQIAIVVLLALTFVCPEAARGPKGRRLPGWLQLAIALIAVGLVSSFFVNRTTALTGMRISYFSVLLVAVVWRCPFDRRDRDHLVTIFMILAVVTSLIGLWQQQVGHEYLHDLGYRYDDEIRFTVGMTLRSFSTFDLPTSFALYLMLAVLLGLPVALGDPRRIRNRLFLISLPLIAIAMLFTFLRGALLGLGIGLLYLAFHRYKILVYGIPWVLCAALFIPTGAVLTKAVFSSSSIQERTTSWSERIDLIAEHPFGTGIGSTGAAAVDVAKTLRRGDTAFQPDNTYLKEAFELGVIGLWLLIFLFVAMFLSTRQVERRVSGPDVDFVVGVSAQLLAIGVASAVATYLELIPMDQLFWLMMAIVATIAPASRPGPPLRRPVLRRRTSRRAPPRPATVDPRPIAPAGGEVGA